MIQQAILVGIGGAIGAVLRYCINHLIESSTFPTATLTVNIAGSFALGVLSIVAANSGFSDDVMLFFATGLLGAFTTMSSFSLETINLAKDGNHWIAIAYSGLTFILCISAALIGWSIGDKVLN
tara:strand:- start:1022 stop:1393 length:372 start_codon:yes stop_codon:yes gene_type:complete